MFRQRHIQSEDAYYPVMNRGAGRGVIFAHDAHPALFLELLRWGHALAHRPQMQQRRSSAQLLYAAWGREHANVAPSATVYLSRKAAEYLLNEITDTSG